MKHWKKYLAAAGTGCIVLVLIIILHSSAGKKDTAAEPGNIPVKENLQTAEDFSASQEDTALPEKKVSSSGTETAAAAAIESQSMSEEDLNSEINQLITTYYGAADKTDKVNSSNDNSGKTGAEKQTAEKQTVEKQTTEKQTTEKQTAENKKSETADKKSDIIEAYKNIKNYIKPGLDKDSYVVFTTYDIKLYNIDTLVPGMSSLSVIRDENRAFAISEDTTDVKLKEYIQKLAKEKDIKSIISKVNSKLTDAVKKDTSLKGFIDYLE